MKYAIAFLLLLLTTKGLVMFVSAMSSLQTDYAIVPLYAAQLIEKNGAEKYLIQLMGEHQNHVLSVQIGALIIVVSFALWQWWYARYFPQCPSSA